MECGCELNALIERAKTAVENSKKLTTKQRKKLKDSTFCGPGRSFPVPDCAHYTAALRLLNRSKYSDSTKANIRACIMRKGKKLGCSGAKKKEKSHYSTYLTKDILALCEEMPDLAYTKNLVEASLRNPGKDIEFYIEQTEE